MEGRSYLTSGSVHPCDGDSEVVGGGEEGTRQARETSRRAEPPPSPGPDPPAVSAESTGDSDLSAEPDLGTNAGSDPSVIRPSDDSCTLGAYRSLMGSDSSRLVSLFFSPASLSSNPVNLSDDSFPPSPICACIVLSSIPS